MLRKARAVEIENISKMSHCVMTQAYEPESESNGPCLVKDAGWGERVNKTDFVIRNNTSDPQH